MNLQQNGQKVNQNLNVWYNLTNILTVIFLLLAFSPIALDIISLAIYTVDSPKLEVQTQSDAKKAIFTISLLAIMHVINFIICYIASKASSDEPDQSKSRGVNSILKYFNQFWNERVNMVKAQCYFFGTFLPIIIALSFRLQIIGKYQISDNINRILECHSLNLITTCVFYLFLITLIFMLNINELRQNGKLTCGNIFKEFLLIYTCGIIDLGKRDEPALSEQFLETDTSNERKESQQRKISDNLGKISFEIINKLGEFDNLKFIV